jgi:MSHA pilin protein MshA
MNKHKGFTLLELIIVIVILGILAAFAVPKYMNLDKEARKSTIRSLSGSLMAASEMVHAIAIAQDRASGASSVNIGSSNITVNAGYPTADFAGIGSSLSDISGFSNANAAAGNYILEKDGASAKTTCRAWYSYGGTGTPVISSNTDNCS